jgi:hypothetical protein
MELESKDELVTRMGRGAPHCEENERLRGMVLRAAGRIVEIATSFQSSVAAAKIDETALSFTAMHSSMNKCEGAYAAWIEHCASHRCSGAPSRYSI